ncbi:MAG: hypothetical protein LUG56_10220, partial [Lachnospiraceae bacterium]|nr:hypothetical protein [Lachnospiraceae bacterium]
MRNRKRFMALLLATVLVCSQVPSIGSSVTAEETEATTDAAEASTDVTGENSTNDDTDNTNMDSAEDTQTGELAGLGSDGAAVAASDEGTDDTGTDAGTDEDGEDTGSGEGSDDSGEDTGSGEGVDDRGEDTGSVEDSGTGEDDADNSDAGEDEDAGDGSDTGDDEDAGGADDTGDDENEDDEGWELVVESSHSYENESGGFEKILVGATATETITFYSYLYRDVMNDEGEITGGEGKDYTNVILDDDSYTLQVDYNGYDGIVEVEAAINDEGSITLTSTGLSAGEANIYVNVLNGEETFCTARVWYSVTEGYYKLESDIIGDYVDIELGEDFDPADYEFHLYKVSYDGTDTVKEEIDSDDYWIELYDLMWGLVFEDKGKNDDGDDVLINRNQLAADTFELSDGEFIYYPCIVGIAARSVEDNSILVSDFSTYCYISNLIYYIELNLTDEHLNEYGSYVVYGSDQTIELSKPDWASRYLPEGYTVTWDINDESAPISIVENDNESWTISVTEADRDWDGSWVSVTATAWYDTDGDGEGDLELATSDDLWFEIVIPYTEYDEIGDITIVLGNGCGIDTNIYYSSRSYENPWGFDGNVTLTSLEIESQYEYTDEGEMLTDDVIYLNGEASDGWVDVNTNKCGYANMLATYVDADGNEQSFEFVIYVTGEYYSLDITRNSSSHEWIAVGQTKEAALSLEYSYTDENNNVVSEVIDLNDTGYTVEISTEDESILTCVQSEDDANTLIFTGVSSGEATTWITISDADGNELTSGEIWWGVGDDNFELAGDVENVGIGESLDWSGLTIEYTYIDEEGGTKTNSYLISELTDGNLNSEFEINGTKYLLNLRDYDTNAWTVAEGTEDDLVPTLIRTASYATDVWMVLQNYDEYDDYWYDTWYDYVFETLDYGLDLSLLTENAESIDDWSIYVGIPATVTYSPSEGSLEMPEGTEYEWTVYYDDGSEAENGNLVSWVVNDDGSLTITAISSERDIFINLHVLYDGYEFLETGWQYISTGNEGEYLDIGVEENVISQGESTNIYGYYGGNSSQLTITDVAVTNCDEDMNPTDKEIATVSYDEENDCWVVAANTNNDNGVAVLTVTYVDPYTGNEGTWEIRVSVSNDFTWLEYESSYTINRPEDNNTIEIPVTLYQRTSTYNEESGKYEISNDQLPILAVEYADDVEDSYPDESVLEVTWEIKDDGTAVIIVTGVEEGRTNFAFRVTTGDADDEDSQWQTREYWIDVKVNGKLDATIDANEYTVEKEYGDEDFNLVEAAGIATNSDADLQYTILEGEDVVKIDENGDIEIIGIGTAIIKVYVEETNTYSYAKVNVTINVDKAETTISASDQTVTYGKTTTLALEATANRDGDLTYEVTSGADVVSVSSDGIVTVKKAGVATITISAAETDLYKAATKTITVTVQEAETEETETEETEATKTAAAIALETSAQTVTYGQSIILTAENLGLTVTGDGELVFEVTSGTDVLSIDDDGTTATTLKAGTAVITVTTTETDLYTAAEPVTITVTVNKADGAASVTIGSWVSGMSETDVLTALSSTNGTGNVTYYYKLQGADDSTYTTTVPTEAGNYTLLAVFAETDCYNAVSVTYDFTIVDSETPSTETETPSTETETPATETETPSTETETPATESETPATETETPATETETPATETEATA